MNFKNGIYFEADKGNGGEPDVIDVEKGKEPMIPKSRFDSVYERAQKLESRLEQLEQERKAENEKRLMEQENWKQLAEERAAKLEEAERKAQKADSYEQQAEERYQKIFDTLPESMQKALPKKYSTIDRLNWIEDNREIFAKPQPPDTTGRRGAGGSGVEIDLTEEEIAMAKKFGISAEDYAKYKK